MQKQLVCLVLPSNVAKINVLSIVRSKSAIRQGYGSFVVRKVAFVLETYLSKNGKRATFMRFTRFRAENAEK